VGLETNLRVWAAKDLCNFDFNRKRTRFPEKRLHFIQNLNKIGFNIISNFNRKSVIQNICFSGRIPFLTSHDAKLLTVVAFFHTCENNHSFISIIIIITYDSCNNLAQIMLHLFPNETVAF
jgi:hypothetical protein